jgi:hypothetical protein
MSAEQQARVDRAIAKFRAAADEAAEKADMARFCAYICGSPLDPDDDTDLETAIARHTAAEEAATARAETDALVKISEADAWVGTATSAQLWSLVLDPDRRRKAFCWEVRRALLKRLMLEWIEEGADEVEAAEHAIRVMESRRSEWRARQRAFMEEVRRAVEMDEMEVDTVAVAVVVHAAQPAAVAETTVSEAAVYSVPRGPAPATTNESV